MNQLPDDCIFETMKWLGPANIQFMRACKRILAIFEKNRTSLELFRARLSTVISHWGNEVYSLELSNTLYPNKKIFIEDGGYGDAVRDSEKKIVDNYRDVKLSKEVLKKVIFANDKANISFYISTLSRDGTECYSFMVYHEKGRKPCALKCMVYDINAGLCVGGAYPTNLTGRVFRHTKDDIIRVEMGNEIAWCHDFGEYARICKYILKFPEIPPEILYCYREATKYLVETIGPPEAEKML